MSLGVLTLPDLIGLIGVALILLAYALLQVERIDPKSMRYSVFNGVGAVLILISLIYDFNLASFIIECAWLIISIFGIVKAFLSRKVS